MQTPNLVSIKPNLGIGTGGLLPIGGKPLVPPPTPNKPSGILSLSGAGQTAQNIMQTGGSNSSVLGGQSGIKTASVTQPTATSATSTFPGMASLNPNASKIADLQSQIASTQGQLNSANTAGYGQGGQFAGQQIPGTTNQQTGQVVPPQQPNPIMNVPEAFANPSNQNGQSQINNQTPTDPNAKPGLVTVPGNQTNYQNTDADAIHQQAIKDAAARSQQQGSDYTARQNEAEAYNNALKQSRMNEAQGLAANASNPIPLEFQQGRAQVLQSQYAQEQAALGSAFQGASNLVGAANTQQGIQKDYLGNVISGTAPVTGVPYGTQTINPVTGQPYGGQTGQGGTNVDPNNPMTSIPSLAQAVANGQMTIDQANSALGNNIGMTTNLRNQILKNNPNFNFTQSSSSGATQAIGQQVKTYSDSANAALDKLTSDFANLPDWQKLGIPGTIGIEQAIGKFFGNDKLSTYQTTLHDARAQLTGVLSTAGGMTPTSAGDTAQTYLPDNMTRDQLPAKIEAAKTLVAQKVQAFQNSGKQSSSSGAGSGTMFGNFNG